MECTRENIINLIIDSKDPNLSSQDVIEDEITSGDKPSDGLLTIKDDELELSLTDFAVVRHYTFDEVEARVKGQYQGSPVDGTYVYAFDATRPRSEFYGIPDNGEDGGPILNAIDDDPDVEAKVKSVYHNELHDHDDDEPNDYSGFGETSFDGTEFGNDGDDHVQDDLDISDNPD